MRVSTTELEGVLIIEPKIFTDSRGYFYETYQSERYGKHAIPERFVQDNISHSTKDAIRGLHYQLEKPQGKLVYVLYGAVLDVIVDVRAGSTTFGKVFTYELNDVNRTQIYIPPGYAHGFCVLSDSAGFAYKCTDYYHPQSEYGIHWNDPDLNIQWPTMTPVVSAKDDLNPRLKDMLPEHLPR